MSLWSSARVLTTPSTLCIWKLLSYLKQVGDPQRSGDCYLSAGFDEPVAILELENIWRLKYAWGHEANTEDGLDYGSKWSHTTHRHPDPHRTLMSSGNGAKPLAKNPRKQETQHTCSSTAMNNTNTTVYSVLRVTSLGEASLSISAISEQWVQNQLVILSIHRILHEYTFPGYIARNLTSIRYPTPPQGILLNYSFPHLW